MRPETDEHLDRAVKAMLAAQTAGRQLGGRSGLSGIQYAISRDAVRSDGSVDALSRETLKPRTGTRPTRHQQRHWLPTILPLLLQQLDQYWDLAPEPVLLQIRKVLTDSDQPLAREAAARALGHMADPGAMPALIKGLGDRTKMVQTASAYAVRMVLSRRQDAAPAGRKLLAAALSSPDARTRWGAAPVCSISISAI